ncbi:MAG TPA: uroporphyrinogen-III synthase [Acidimicrobiales bacterium]|nr:uroporphyrinogen-III synthase [Acidimicrobiales bacterium]
MIAVVTREAGRNSDLAKWIGDAADVVEAPLTRTEYRDVDEVAREIQSGAPYGALVVTSSRAGAYLDAALAALEKGARVYAVGPATAQVLAARGAAVAAVGEGGAESLADVVEGSSVLVVGARESREELPAALVARGLVVTRVAAYDTVAMPVDDGVAWALARADVVVVAAPSTWSVARAYVGSGAWVVVPGETTAAAVRKDHARVVVAWGEGLGAVVAQLDAR